MFEKEVIVHSPHAGGMNLFTQREKGKEVIVCGDARI
jgi:hypothetical protein